MKRIFSIVCLVIVIGGILYASGFHFGLPSAVKSKVKELDKKVKKKKLQDQVVLTPQSLAGTCAKGAPIASVTVTIKDANGSSATGTTGATGKFDIDVKGLTFPMLLRVTEGAVQYYSIASASGTCNIHPFTDLVVRTYWKSAKGISDVNDAFENNYSSFGTLPAAEIINVIKATVVNIIGSILERNNLDPLSYDMFITSFDADSTGFDKVLEETLVAADSTYSTVTVKDTTTDVIISTITPTANDTTAPSVPTNLSAAGTSATTMKIAWTASAETDVAGYAIYRDGVKIAAVPYTLYIDDGLTVDVQYSYTVAAFDWAGNMSAQPSAVTATTLSEFPIAVTSNPEWIGLSAYDGTNYLVTFTEQISGTFFLKAQFVSGSGELVGSAFLIGDTVEGENPNVPLLAFGNGTYLIVWDSLDDFMGALISTSGTVGTHFVISNEADSQIPSGLGFDGTNFMVVWSDDREGPDIEDIYGQRIDTNGEILGPEIPICTAANEQRWPHLAYSNGQYLVVWVDWRKGGSSEGDDIYGQFVNTLGKLVGSNFLIDGNNYPSSNDSFVASDGTNYFVTLHDEVNDEWDLYARIVSHSGSISSRITISNKSGDNHFAFPIFDGTKYLVTWVDKLETVSTSNQARFFDTSGNTLGQELTLLTPKGSENAIFSGAIYDGGKYFLSILRAVLVDDSGGFNAVDGDIYGMFINP